jgi:glycogen phosphorylase
MRLTPAVLPTKLAYFSMEVGVDPRIPTYSGGLGVLAGDTLRQAADLHVPMVGVTLLQRRGYLHQRLDAAGNQSEGPTLWRPEDLLELQSPRVSVTIESREVQIRIWCYRVEGVTGHTIPLYFLDTDLEGNDAWDRSLTGQLYGGDERYRLSQEVILGIGGLAALRALGHGPDLQHHMNEGHSSLLALALLERQLRNRPLRLATEADVEVVRARCIFTTHTPVPAGHDMFPLELVRLILGNERTEALQRCECILDGKLNMTHLAMRFSRYINGVAMQHGEVSRNMFQFPINAITNGVHAITWTSPPVRELFDHHIPAWRRDNLYLRYALKIPLEEIRAAHAEAKGRLLAEIDRREGLRLDPEVFTIGYARRATVYKRATFIVQDLERLRRLSKQAGRLQLVFAGKAHPNDTDGKNLIRQLFTAAASLGTELRLVFLENYEMELALSLVSGVDLWLNTPRRPQEASGTSGMKAALNGVPSLSVRDGWWVEGHQEGVTGWDFGDSFEPDSPAELESLYDKLEQVIVPLYYQKPLEYAMVMRNAIALNGSFFNTQRMLLQYLTNAYFPPEVPNPAPASAPVRH